MDGAIERRASGSSLPSITQDRLEWALEMIRVLNNMTPFLITVFDVYCSVISQRRLPNS
ncbi:hypothetical protein AE02_03352 [Klebsiella variicola]|nr:hypothetical protein AE02_03352 [Klebsiella variicola]